MSNANRGGMKTLAWRRRHLQRWHSYSMSGSTEGRNAPAELHLCCCCWTDTGSFTATCRILEGVCLKPMKTGSQSWSRHTSSCSFTPLCTQLRLCAAWRKELLVIAVTQKSPPLSQSVREVLGQLTVMCENCHVQNCKLLMLGCFMSALSGLLTVPHDLQPHWWDEISLKNNLQDYSSLSAVLPFFLHHTPAKYCY